MEWGPQDGGLGSRASQLAQQGPAAGNIAFVTSQQPPRARQPSNQRLHHRSFSSALMFMCSHVNYSCRRFAGAPARSRALRYQS